MAAIVAEVQSAPRSEVDPDVRPGLFNRAGQFFDLRGKPLERRATHVLPGKARELVETGAELAFEGCGCGGWTGCQPSWIAEERRITLAESGKPRFVRGFGSPTFIDVWTNDDTTVVFLHGDVEWNGPDNSRLRS